MVLIVKVVALKKAVGGVDGTVHMLLFKAFLALASARRCASHSSLVVLGKMLGQYLWPLNWEWSGDDITFPQILQQ